MGIQAIILAAGVGQRMLPLTKDKPKALLEYQGETLLERIVKQVSSRGITRVSVVVGHGERKVVARLKEFEYLDIALIKNKRFREDKNILSLTLALRNRLMPFVLIEADTIISDACFDDILNIEDRRSLWFTTGPFVSGMYGGIVKVDGQQKVVDLQIVPEYQDSYRGYSKMTGLLKVGPDQLERYYELLVDACEQDTNQYYHAPWISHLEELPSYAVDLSGGGVVSLNTVEEYHAALGISLVDVDKLRPIEGYSSKRAKWLQNKIVKEGAWRKPLAVEKDAYLVMDGMHRLEVAKKLNLARVPCQMFPYEAVEVWSLRKQYRVTRETVTRRALAGDIYPYKTAKHGFPVPIHECCFYLEELVESKGVGSQ